MSDDLIEKAEALCKTLFLPWTYFEEDDQIYSQQDDTEYGEYGSILSEGKELIAEFHGKQRSQEIIEAVNIMPELVAEVKRLLIENDNALSDLKHEKEHVEVMHLRRDNELRQMNELGSELARWREIAIKQHALIKFIETEERYAYSEHVILSDKELEQAATELEEAC